MDKNKDEIDVSEHISFKNVNSTLVLKIFINVLLCVQGFYLSHFSVKTARLGCQDMMR